MGSGSEDRAGLPIRDQDYSNGEEQKSLQVQ
jgi:hypothetical protein